jgi:hypothetical protein
MNDEAPHSNYSSWSGIAGNCQGIIKEKDVSIQSFMTEAALLLGPLDLDQEDHERVLNTLSRTTSQLIIVGVMSIYLPMTMMDSKPENYAQNGRVTFHTPGGQDRWRE